MDVRSPRWRIDPCSPREAGELARALDVSEITASVLLRRGLSDPELARGFLAGEQPLHDPYSLGDMDAACAAIRRAVEARKRICVHGDYDADGICATALAVAVLREVGADVEWHLPSRFDEGYGLSGSTLTRLAEEGCGLVLTVDCGITAVEEVAEARRRGLEVIVTDHHRPGERLPECPLVVTRPSRYPFPELCGTGVAFKLAQALLGPESAVVRRQLDLVALATIADVVPLVGENRSLAIAGLRALAVTQRPGLRALMRCSRVDGASLDAGAVGFRLAPRLNAAGRLGHPAVALELLLTDDAERASELASRLEELNRERQIVEERMLREALGKIADWPEAERQRRAYVVADEGWHEGVIGIVASRLVERFSRPVVLIAGAGEQWKGSGRSIPAFDLHAGLTACAGHLERYGGHRAAAGLSIRPERVPDFAAALAGYAESKVDFAELQPDTVVDAIVPARELNLALCSELQRLAPFGLDNPGVTLLVTGCELDGLARVGDGRHLRFRLRQNGRPGVGAIGFGLGAQIDSLRTIAGYDVAFRLEENRWNGTVAPQLVVKGIFETPDRYEELRRWLAGEWKRGVDGRSGEAGKIFAELGLDGSTPAWRSLLESETFRALLRQPELAAAA